jgi:hypothetical protein
MDSLTKLPPKELIDFLDLFGTHHTFAVIGKVNTHFHGTLLEHYTTLCQLNKEGSGVYFIPCETNLEGAELTDIKSARAVFIDDDNPRPSHKTAFAIPPTAIIETSEGKYHYYWHTKTSDLVTWRSVQKTIIALYDGDKVIHNPNRIMRLPTFIHQKTGFISHVVSSSTIKYNFSRVLDTWPPITSPIIPAVSTSSRTMDDMIAVIAAGLADTGLHSSTRDYAYGQVQDGVKPATIKANLRNIMKDYDLSNPRMLENWAKVEALVDSQYRKYHETKYGGIEIPDIAQPLEWDWSVLRSNAIPEDCLPESLLSAAKEIGDWTATGQDPAILSAVFITNALLSKNIVIHEIEDDHVTHSQSGIVIVMDTGARKSSIYRQMNKPFFEYEERLQEEWEEHKNQNQAMASILKKQISNKEKKAEKSEASSEILAAALAIGELQDDIDKIQVKKPSLRCADVTEEKLVRKLDENDGCMAVISDDARQVINNLKGKYNDKVSGESVYINSLTGSEIIYERVGSDKEIHIAHPVLNALLFVQPDAALSLKNSEMYVPSGLAARLPMYFYPVSGVDIVDNTQRRTINKSKMQSYYQALRSLCLKTNRYKNPLHIRLSASGMDACRRMDKELVGLLKSSWEGEYPKVNKIVTLSTMYATAFAALDDRDFRDSYSDTERKDPVYMLSTKYLNMGFAFAKSLFSQAISSNHSIEKEALPRKASSLIATIIKWYDSGKVTEGFVVQGDFKNFIYSGLRDSVPDTIDMLVDKGWLYLTRMSDQKRKLNGGFPNKLVDTGDFIYHLNKEAILKYRHNLDKESAKNLPKNVKEL